MNVGDVLMKKWCFGTGRSKVREEAVMNTSGEVQTYRIVGADEADAKTSAISMDSPLARALLSKRIDDEVIVQTGEKTATFSVVAIRYEPHRQTSGNK